MFEQGNSNLKKKKFSCPIFNRMWSMRMECFVLYFTATCLYLLLMPDTCDLIKQALSYTLMPVMVNDRRTVAVRGDHVILTTH